MPTTYHVGQTIDHYQLVRALGQNMAGSVYLARDLDSLQEVVLKFPSDELIGAAAVFARYRREAEIGRRKSLIIPM